MEIKDVQKKLIEDGLSETKKNGEEKPPLESTTLWDYPKQSYGKTPKGNNKFQGVTPAFIIYNMVSRYTIENDLVLDPMCGSGTTIDVCKEEKRRVIGFDVHPQREDIIKNDSRKIPLDSDSVDMIFIDSPYGDNVNYSDDPENIGKLSAESDDFCLYAGRQLGFYFIKVSKNTPLQALQPIVQQGYRYVLSDKDYALFLKKMRR